MPERRGDAAIEKAWFCFVFELETRHFGVGAAGSGFGCRRIRILEWGARIFKIFKFFKFFKFFKLGEIQLEKLEKLENFANF